MFAYTCDVILAIDVSVCILWLLCSNVVAVMQSVY